MLFVSTLFSRKKQSKAYDLMKKYEKVWRRQQKWNIFVDDNGLLTFPICQLYLALCPWKCFLLQYVYSTLKSKIKWYFGNSKELISS